MGKPDGPVYRKQLLVSAGQGDVNWYRPALKTIGFFFRLGVGAIPACLALTQWNLAQCCKQASVG